ncbi:MAG: AMP-binding protein [Flexilinea sp.]
METILSRYHNNYLSENPNRTAIRWLDSSLNCVEISRKKLENESNRRANFLVGKNCKPGDHIFLFLQSSPEIWYFFIGALKCGAIPCVLFPNFGEDAIRARLLIGKVDFLITDTLLDRFKELFLSIPTLKMNICLNHLPEPQLLNEKICYLDDELNFLSDQFSDYPVQLHDSAFMVFTSGSTGFPKAVIHSQRIADSICRSMENVLQVTKQDRFWCTAHPAWITGTVYSILGPLLSGIESVQYSGNFHAKRWMPILQDQKVSVWYSAPTAFRSLMNEPAEFYKGYDFSALRNIFSVGEPLNPKVYYWGREIFNREIHDTWFQTEAGTIRIANLPEETIKPGLMGKAVDDARPIILNDRNEETERNEIGRLCLKEGWESCFIDYFGQRSAFASKFQSGFYETGDLAYEDEDGCFCFVGRDDDVINTSGHLIGPFEVESVLLEQEEITDVAVAAAPDELLYEKVAAFIVLRKGIEWDTKLESKLRVAVTTRLSPIATPKVFIIVDGIPRNNAGKILRNELREKLKRMPLD